MQELLDEKNKINSIKHRGITAAIFGMVGFEVFYLIALWYNKNVDLINPYVIVAMAFPVIGIVMAFLYKRIKLTASLVMLFIGTVYIFLEIFVIGTLISLSRGMANVLVIVLIFGGITVPNLICGIMYVHNSVRGIRLYKTEQQKIGGIRNYKISLILSVIVAIICAAATYFSVLYLLSK